MKNLLLPLACSAMLTLAAAAAAAAATARGAMGNPEHSKVQVTAAPAGDHLTLIFKVEPTSGLHINMEGPWKLDITTHDGLAFAKDTYSKGDMSEALPGFTATTTAKPTKPAGDVEYSLVAFVCTDDKTQCYREVHKGRAPWTVAGK